MLTSAKRVVNHILGHAYLSVIVLVLLIASVETLLEVRHYYRGFDTLLFGKRAPSVSSEATLSTSTFGPTPTFPFRSLIPKNNTEQLRSIWIASASHAEHIRFPADALFPNLICAHIKPTEPCFVVNGSKAGMNIDSNLALLGEWKNSVKPKTAMLYQMAIFLADEQSSSTKEDSIQTEKASTPHTFDAAMKPLHTMLQSSSLYLHISEYITANLEIYGPRDATLPGIEAEYAKKLKTFITYCNNNNIEPVLTTFAIAHHSNNLHIAKRSFLTTLIRQNKKLSVKGYIDTVEKLNATIRTVALDYNVRYVDIAKRIGGQPEYFVDFVHFNQAGHKVVAQEIANVLTAGQP